MQWQSLVIVVDLCLTNHTNLLLFHFQKGNVRKKWFVGEASKFRGLVNGLKWSWLHYVEDEDVVLCYTCGHAYPEKKLHWKIFT